METSPRFGTLADADRIIIELMKIPRLAFISGGLFGAIVLAVIAGDAVITSGAVRNQAAFEAPAKIVFFTLFVAFGFSLIPLMVAVVLAGLDLIRKRAKRAAVPAANLPARLDRLANLGLMAAGLAIALPAAVHAGFFGNESVSPAAVAERNAAQAIAQTPSQGTLVAAPGMAVGRMISESSLRVQRGSESELFSGARFGGAAIFDYDIAGTAMTFPRCRYYYITTYARRPSRIATINIGISAEKLSRTALEAANRDIRARLIADGWHRSGQLWVRSGIVLDLRSRRLDDPVAGENRANAGEWIAFVELREAKAVTKIH